MEKNGRRYHITPFGPFLENCVHNIPNGAHVTHVDNMTIVFDPLTGQINKIPPCASAEPLLGKEDVGSYDGWLAYTSFHYPAGISKFLGYFSVPSAPEYDPQVLYLFTGLQNVNWIPIVDPPPSVFGIIQPCLLYTSPSPRDRTRSRMPSSA
eukprot:TRINITY_DN16084_c0_g1_i2.p1 TRINITY_DN16084_c0_g1~~TRINITY_DN16084_c0_g1_i2.p1  ORF type:complete len:172 (+),score=10.14 TRINITY_DN16084_c0_g1_i2:62-517(+)